MSQGDPGFVDIGGARWGVCVAQVIYAHIQTNIAQKKRKKKCVNRRVNNETYGQTDKQIYD